MTRRLNTLFALLSVLVMTLSQARAQDAPVYFQRKVNANFNDQSRFINVVKHFYTASWQEAWNSYYFYGYYFTGTVTRGWSGPGAGLKPVYRLYRVSTDAHYYTSDYNQVVQLQYPGVGFTYEGIAFYVSTYQRPGTYPVYRVDRNYSPAQYFLWWQTSPEVPETHMLTMRSSDVTYATNSYGFFINNYFGDLIGYAAPGNMGVD